MAERDGKRPLPSEVFEQIHTRKEGEVKVFCDPRSKSVWDTYQALKLNAAQSGTEVNEEELFLQAVGGIDKKGTVYGLGSESKAYYKRQRSSGPSSDTFTYTPSVVSQMEARLKKSEDELQATREELRATREEQKQHTELIKLLLARFEASSSHPQPPPSS